MDHALSYFVPMYVQVRKQENNPETEREGDRQTKWELRTKHDSQIFI